MDPSAYEHSHAAFFSKATGILHKANVPIIAGTDSGSFAIIPGKSLINELELLVKAGLSNFEALNSATDVSAQVLGFDKTGIIKTGYRANLLLLTKNPLTSIKNLDSLTEVIIRGQLVDSDKINDLQLAAGDTSFVRSLWRFLELQCFII
jgi:imidazolonepropionase-like amidohydrolase